VSDLSIPALELRRRLADPAPVLALAPMQDVTDYEFVHLLSRFGGPDVSFIEYLRVTADSRLDPKILRCALENRTGRPVVLQLIGNDPVHLRRAALQLQEHPLAAIDLNLGCPAPRVFNKCAGGGLLGAPDRIDSILGTLRHAITRCLFTVKTRIGVEDAEDFDTLLSIYRKHQPDLLTVHGRTVREMYRPGVRLDWIARAAAEMPCPVLANGDVCCADAAMRTLSATGARGLMIGRGAIANPWIFDQIRQAWSGATPHRPGGRDMLGYIRALYLAATDPGYREIDRVHRIKKHLNFLLPPLDADGSLLHKIRRAREESELFELCAQAFDHDQPVPPCPCGARAGTGQDPAFPA
jgi:tRNA-dihydrouridine synthase B